MAIEINAELRTDLGKGASRRLRHEEKIPAIVYGLSEPASLTIDLREVRPHIDNEAFYASIVELKVAGSAAAEQVIVRDIQHHPYKIDIMHIDFQRIDANKTMHMHVQVHYTGEAEAPGVKSGGLINHVINEVEVTCLPKDIPELTALSHGDENHDTAIVSIHAPKVIVEEDEDAVVAAETPSEGAE